MDGIERIAGERQRQIDVEGWTAEHDADHDWPEALAYAAACYAMPDDGRSGPWLNVNWPWAIDWWKPSDDRIRELEKAGALIAAEIDRLQAEAGQQGREP